MSYSLTEIPEMPVVEISIGGTLSESSFAEISERIDHLIELHKRIRVLEYINPQGALDPSAFLVGVKLEPHQVRCISHLAVVTELPWIQFLTNAIAMSVPVTTRLFSMEEIESARSWILDPNSSRH